jgi:predicted metal-binding protein
MPEVVEQAARLWAERGGAPGLEFVGLDLLSEALPAPSSEALHWDAVVLSNIVHVYGEAESCRLLEQAAEAVAPGGLIIVHDFWTHGPGRGPAKAALFDLHMLVNTYQGRTYSWAWVRDRLAALGLATLAPVSLGEGHEEEDTSLVVAAKDSAALDAVDRGPLERLVSAALDLGFARSAPLDPAAVVTGTWVREKCRFGCSGYGASGQCPPRSPAPQDTHTLLGEYGSAVLVQGTPPTRDFHLRMLALERAAFLRGHSKALVFPAGPCRLCAECAPDECVRPGEARPSMEASGIDVYGTAAAAGWHLEPVPDGESPVSYIGLLLVD